MRRLINIGALQGVEAGVRALTEGGVDRHREPDLMTEPHRERVLELAPQPTLELGAGELVTDRDDRGVAVQGDRFTGADPGLLVGLQLVDDVLPGSREVRVVVHRKFRSLLRRACRRWTYGRAGPCQQVADLGST